MRLLTRPLPAFALIAALCVAALAGEAIARPGERPAQPSPYANAWDSVTGRDFGGESLIQQEILLPRPRSLIDALDRRGYDVVEIVSYSDRLAVVSVCDRGRLQDLEISAPFELRFLASRGACEPVTPAPQSYRPPRLLYLD